MTQVAVIEDDLPTSNQLAGWIKAARPDVATGPAGATPMALSCGLKA